MDGDRPPTLHLGDVEYVRADHHAALVREAVEKEREGCAGILDQEERFAQENLDAYKHGTESGLQPRGTHDIGLVWRDRMILGRRYARAIRTRTAIPGTEEGGK